MSINLGKLRGIPVTVDVSWFFIFALIVYTLAMSYFPSVSPGTPQILHWVGGVIAALFLFFSVLVHEYMHSFVAKRNGIPISGITLFIFGGVSRMEEEPKTPAIEFKMAIAGPLTSLVLAGVFWGVSVLAGMGLGDFGLTIIGYLAIINFMLAMFNMIPGFPLDGGRVLRAILWSSLNSLERATNIASKVGQGFGFAFMFGGFWMMFAGGFLSGLWLVFIGWFLNNAAQQSYRQLELRQALSGVEVGRIMTSDFVHVDPDVSVESFVNDYLLTHEYSCFPVTDGDSLVGIVTLDEVRALDKERWAVTRVREIAKTPESERVISDTDDAFDAMTHMAEGNLTRLLVMHDGRLRGVVDRDSLVNLVRTKMRLGI